MKRQKPKRLNLSKLTAKYVGTPYKLGGQTIAEGLDCLSLMLNIGRDLKIPLPEEFEGITRENYGDYWLTYPDKAKLRFSRFVSTLGESVPIEKAFAGDFLVFTYKDGPIMIGLHAGQDLLLSAFADIGKIAVVSFRDYQIKRVIRWRGLKWQA